VKRKLLWVGDAGVSTGFARVTHGILDTLRATWDVGVLGVNYHGDPHDYPYPIWPCVAPYDDAHDAFGIERLPKIIRRFGPDVIVVQNDPWNVPKYLRAVGNVPTVGFVAVDGKNCRGGGMNGLALAVFWTEFGREQARLGGYSGPTAVVPLGVDLDVYRPLDRAATRAHHARLLFGPRFPVDGFIVGVVGRNQQRKRLDLAIAYFAEWIRTTRRDDAYLYLYVAPTGDEGFDVTQLAGYYGMANRAIVVEPHVGHGNREALLNEIYNTFDVLLSTSQAEGWSLPTMEAMAAGVPCVVPDWAALGEWPEDAAVKIPCSTFACTPNKINVVCGVPDRAPTIAALDRLYADPAFRAELGQRGRDLVARPQFRWPAIGAAFRDALDVALVLRGTGAAVEAPALAPVAAP